MRIMMMIIIMRIIMMNDVRFAALAAILPKRPNRAKTRRDDREPTSQPASSKAPKLHICRPRRPGWPPQSSLAGHIRTIHEHFLNPGTVGHSLVSRVHTGQAASAYVANRKRPVRLM